ncbi:MAG TPA: M20/M25/M40 family metallo-hydrolase [Gemmatimonadales bacterium]|nr:M20/M25/M40 family metallo-hydrolase [Gemmatimonadales bacterium]
MSRSHGVLALLSILPAILSAQAKPVSVAEAQAVLAPFVGTYAPSGMEAPMRDAVRRALPAWARPSVDSAGDLLLSVGRGAPHVVFIAHMDEIGFSVTAIRDDGSLELRPLGGFLPSLFEAEPALVHTGAADVPGVFTPADSQPAGRRGLAFRVDLGVTTRAAAESLGVSVGNSVTMPKSYARLAGTRATGRSFDDRVGAAALVLAVRHLDRSRLRHAVTFVWSVREETGLDGAQVVARSLGTSVARVHAIDTFVSADSPLEPQNFAVAPLGRGPVARAVDQSSVTPPAYVDSLVALARARRIPLQVGATNGGNDGSAFAPWGVVDVPIGWALRYAHSPVEVADLRDVAGLADLVRAVAEGW